MIFLRKILLAYVGVTLKAALFITCLTVCIPAVLADEATFQLDRIGFRHGNTYVPQNIKMVSESELFYQTTVNPIQTFLPPYLRAMHEFNLGEISTTGGNGYLFGWGPRIELSLHPKLNTGGAFRFVYLDRYVYESPQNRVKHYGGHRQFQYYWEANFEVLDEFSIGYRWQHMSNGRQVLPKPYKYRHNPVINTHNLVIKYNF